MASRYHQYSLTSSPWLPCEPVRPKARSFRIGSRPLHSARPRHSRFSTSHKPGQPAPPPPLLHAADPGQPVLAPPVRVGPGIVVRYVVPRVAVGAVVLAHRPPLPLADVRPPRVPF